MGNFRLLFNYFVFYISGGLYFSSNQNTTSVSFQFSALLLSSYSYIHCIQDLMKGHNIKPVIWSWGCKFMTLQLIGYQLHQSANVKQKWCVNQQESILTSGNMDCNCDQSQEPPLKPFPALGQILGQNTFTTGYYSKYTN